ncbi:MAG: hypothetical protein [Circular genetic element sp.]|nr:MAG: hypothetical protein [Circular genetic element sp.]
MSQNTLLYSELASGNQYFNLCRDLSWMNSKNHEHTDRDGHVIGYICNVKVHGTVQNSISLGGAPNTWKMRNAFRKWHAYRDLMFSEAGVTESEIGRYGKTIRPYVDPDMKTGTIKDPVGWDLTTQTQEWTYTEIAATPGIGEGALSGTGVVNVYDLHICGVNDVDSTSPSGAQFYNAVGMIHSYNQDRMEVVTPTLDSQTVEGQNNPLALLKQGGSTSGGEVMDIVQDQELEAPPYDITDNGFSTNLGIYDIIQINPGYDGSGSVPVLRAAQVFVPAGILKLYAGAEDRGASLLIDVVGMVLCKDMA